MRRRRWASAWVGSLLLGFATTSGAVAAATDPLVVFVAERTGAAPNGVLVEANFAFSNSGGYVAYIGAQQTAGHLSVTDGGANDLVPDLDAYATVAGTTAGCMGGSPCAISTLAGSRGGLAQYLVAYPKNLGQPARIYVVIRGHDIKVQVDDSPGWRVHRSALQARTTSGSYTGTAATVRAAANTIDHFTSATLVSNSPASLALGTPPCRPLHKFGYAREGRGTVSLTGGAKNTTFDCAELGSSDPVSSATGPTTWHLGGDVAGIATGPTRLLVVDL